MKKCIISAFLSLLMILTTTSPFAFADTRNCDITQNEENELIWHDIADLESLPISETYTYDELENLFIANGYSEEEITKYIGPKLLTRGTSVRYALMQMHRYYYTTQSLDFIVQARFTAGLEYADGATSPSRIVSLEGAHMYTGASGLLNQCSFSGNIFYRLAAGNEFYYNFYGDLYKVGTMNVSASVTVGISEAATATITLSNGDGYLLNVSEAETYHAEGLNP